MPICLEQTAEYKSTGFREELAVTRGQTLGFTGKADTIPVWKVSKLLCYTSAELSIQHDPVMQLGGPVGSVNHVSEGGLARLTHPVHEVKLAHWGQHGMLGNGLGFGYSFDFRDDVLRQSGSK